MVRFTSAPVREVAPKRQQHQPSQRAQIQAQYREALHDTVMDRHEALVVEMNPEDKPLTIRNRLKRAAETLGLRDIVIRRRRNTVVAYLPQDLPE